MSCTAWSVHFLFLVLAAGSDRDRVRGRWQRWGRSPKCSEARRRVEVRGEEEDRRVKGREGIGSHRRVIASCADGGVSASIRLAVAQTGVGHRGNVTDLFLSRAHVPRPSSAVVLPIVGSFLARVPGGSFGVAARAGADSISIPRPRHCHRCQHSRRRRRRSTCRRHTPRTRHAR